MIAKVEDTQILLKHYLTLFFKVSMDTLTYIIW